MRGARLLLWVTADPVTSLELPDANCIEVIYPSIRNQGNGDLANARLYHFLHNRISIASLNMLISPLLCVLMKV